MEVQNEGRGDLHNQRLVLLYPNHQYTTEPHSSLILLPGLRPLLTSLLSYILWTPESACNANIFDVVSPYKSLFLTSATRSRYLQFFWYLLVIKRLFWR